MLLNAQSEFLGVPPGQGPLRVQGMKIERFIFLYQNLTAFIGYVLPFGQMSLWGTQSALDDKMIYFGIYLYILPLKVPSVKRIGPHNKGILEFIYGSLQGDGYLESHGNGCRLCLQQEDSHKDYLMWSYNYLLKHGYTKDKLPIIRNRIGNKGKLRYYISSKTFTYSNLNYLKSIWYISGKKVLPYDISYFQSPLALSIWIMDDGSRVGNGLKLSTNNFTYQECTILRNIQINKYNLKVSIHQTGVINQWNQYISKHSIFEQKQIVNNYLHPSMIYKQSI